MVDGETVPEGYGTVGATDGGTDRVPAGGVATDEALSEGFTAGERRPGDGGLPSAAAGEPPAGSDKPRGALSRLFRRNERRREPAGESPKEERRPRASRGKRKSAADTFGDGLLFLGGVLAQNPSHVPLGRYVQFSSAVNAELADEVVAGTIVDRVLVQRVVSGRERLDKLGAIVVPPALIYRIETHPAEAERLVPLLKMALKNGAPYYLGAMKKVRKRAEAEQAAMDELAADDPDYEPGTPIEDYILHLCFDGWAPPTPEGDVIDVDSQEVRT